MRNLSRLYSLRRLQSSKDRQYPAALSLYATTVPPDARTHSNEITYWLDRTYNEYGDEFCVCAFSLSRKVIGFAEFAFLRESRILFIDYLSLDESHQTQSDYLLFAAMLQASPGHESSRLRSHQ